MPPLSLESSVELWFLFPSLSPGDFDLQEQWISNAHNMYPWQLQLLLPEEHFAACAALYARSSANGHRHGEGMITLSVGSN